MKTHMNLRTKDIGASVGFYRTLLQAPPVKHFDDYALFVVDDPGLELALDFDASVAVNESTHYGIVVDSSDEVDDAIARFGAAGLATDVDREETCCYASQTKVWVVDPDGRRWEVYTVLEDTAVRDGGEVLESSGRACCGG